MLQAAHQDQSGRFLQFLGEEQGQYRQLWEQERGQCHQEWVQERGQRHQEWVLFHAKFFAQIQVFSSALSKDKLVAVVVGEAVVKRGCFILVSQQ